MAISLLLINFPFNKSLIVDVFIAVILMINLAKYINGMRVYLMRVYFVKVELNGCLLKEVPTALNIHVYILHILLLLIVLLLVYLLLFILDFIINNIYAAVMMRYFIFLKLINI